MSQRALLVADIRMLRDHGQSSRLIDNAEHLLTRWWTTATWAARAQLLKSAGWLVRLAAARQE